MSTYPNRPPINPSPSPPPSSLHRRPLYFPHRQVNFLRPFRSLVVHRLARPPAQPKSAHLHFSSHECALRPKGPLIASQFIFGDFLQIARKMSEIGRERERERERKKEVESHSSSDYVPQIWVPEVYQKFWLNRYIRMAEKRRVLRDF